MFSSPPYIFISVVEGLPYLVTLILRKYQWIYVKKPIQGFFFCSFSAKHKKLVLILVCAPSLWSLNDTIVSLSTLEFKGLSACSVSLCLDNWIFMKQCNYYNHYNYFYYSNMPYFRRHCHFYVVIPARLHALLFFPNWLLNFSMRKRHVKENTYFFSKNEGIFCLSLAMV